MPAAGDRAGRARGAAELSAAEPPVRSVTWPGILTIPAGRRAKFVVAAVFFLITAIVGGLFSGKFEDAQKNETVSFLPGKAESVKSLEAVKRYPGGELAPAVIVYERKGGLTAADRARVVAGPAVVRRRPALDRPAAAEAGVLAQRRRGAVLDPDPRHRATPTASRRAMDSIRARVSGEHGGLTVKVTGAAGYRPTRSRSSGTSTARCSA